MPAKKTTKKPASKTTAKKPAVKKVATKVEKNKLDDVKQKLGKEVDYVKKESKVLINNVEGRRNKSSNEEKIFTILGIIALIWGLYVLRHML